MINILTNPVYVGKIRYGDRVYAGRHPGIVPADLFERVQRLLDGTRKRRRPATSKGDHIYLLKGMLRCGKCGAAMAPGCAYGRSRSRYHYYQCTKRIHTGKIACDAKLVRAEAADEFVMEYIKRVACNRKELDEIIARETIRLTTGSSAGCPATEMHSSGR